MHKIDKQVIFIGLKCCGKNAQISMAHIYDSKRKKNDKNYTNLSQAVKRFFFTAPQHQLYSSDKSYTSE